VLVQLKNITKIYRSNGQRALDDVSMNFDKGEIVGLLGVNGSGKTTCSTILAGLHKATSGDLLFRGESVLKNIANYRRHVGYCTQSPNLHKDLTIYENLYYGGLYFGLDHESTKKTVDQTIELLELSDQLKKFPDMLSGGYKQRAMIARTLIPNPEFLIFDEPTAGLDPGIRKKLWKILEKLRGMGKSIVLTTHYLDEADFLCDQICILSEGRIIHQAPKSTLKSQHNNEHLEDIFLKLTTEEQEEK